MASSTAVRATRRVVPLILAGWLAACAGDPQAAFDLAPAVPHPQRPLRAQVHVLDPFAPTELESDRILVRTGPTAGRVGGGPMVRSAAGSSSGAVGRIAAERAGLEGR